jgi:hypothetical protein
MHDRLIVFVVPVRCASEMCQWYVTVSCASEIWQWDVPVRCASEMWQWDMTVRCASEIWQWDVPVRYDSEMWQWDVTVRCASQIKLLCWPCIAHALRVKVTGIVQTFKPVDWFSQNFLKHCYQETLLCALFNIQHQVTVMTWQMCTNIHSLF